MVRDVARPDLPPGSVYDSADYLLHQPGVAQKRGGTAYTGSAFGSTSYVAAAVYCFPLGPQLVAITDDDHLYLSTGTDKGSLGGVGLPVDKPKSVVTGGGEILIIPSGNGTSAPRKYDGSAAPAALSGSPPAGKFCEVYKSRLVLAGATATPNRIFFSPIPNIESTWDTANAWLDVDHPVTGLASLGNQLLVFSRGHIARIIGSSPPPNKDMDLATMWAVGTTDARSITLTDDGRCYFANSGGVYMTNGAEPVCLTRRGGIESYWRSFFGSYDPASWTLSTGITRGFLFATLLNDSRVHQVTLMCNLSTYAWWRVSNFKAMMYASSTLVGLPDELVYADASTNRLVALSGIFTPSGSNKNDASGTAVTPSIEFRPIGDGPGVKAYGFGRLSLDMRDAASDNPTMAVTVKTGIEADTTATPAESPFAETTTLDRKRFTVNTNAQQVTVALAQTNASSKTELYALEVEQRPFPVAGEGVA